MNSDSSGRGRRVNAIILGAQKCATSTLFAALEASPEVGVSRVKETDFFSTTPDWKAGLERYHRLFPRSRRVLLEASPSYTVYPYRNQQIWRDMFEYNPEMRLIYIVRDPVKRMRSGYKHSFERGWTDLSFEDFMLNHEHAHAMSLYARQIAPFIETFGAEQVLLLRFNEVVKQQQAVLEQVSGFLGIDGGFAKRRRTVHANDGKARKYHHRFDNPGLAFKALDIVARPATTWWKRKHSPRITESLEVTEELRAKMIAKFLPDIEEFERISGWDLEAWKQ